MENQSLSLQSYMLKFGAMLGGVSVVFALMLFFLDMHYGQEPAVNYINYAITISIIILGLYNYRKDNEGFLSLSESLKLGLGVSLIAAVISILYTALLYYVLEPDFMVKSMEIAKMKMIDDNPEMTQEQLNMNLELMEKFSGMGTITVVILIFSLFFGFITSLISGLILKRARPE